MIKQTKVCKWGLTFDFRKKVWALSQKVPSGARFVSKKEAKKKRTEDVSER